MNNLVERIKERNFPVLFTKEDINKSGIGNNNLDIYFNEALEKGMIENVYTDYYVLGKGIRDVYIPEVVISQMLDKKSYVSTYSVLSDADWILDGVFTISSVTEGNTKIIDTDQFGSYTYDNIYKNINMAGIYWESINKYKYKRAKPLRALCDMLVMRNENICDVYYIKEIFRIPQYVLEKEITISDIEELQGTLNNKYVELFLNNLKKEFFE